MPLGFGVILRRDGAAHDLPAQLSALIADWTGGVQTPLVKAVSMAERDCTGGSAVCPGLPVDVVVPETAAGFAADWDAMIEACQSDE